MRGSRSWTEQQLGATSTNGGSSLSDSSRRESACLPRRADAELEGQQANKRQALCHLRSLCGRVFTCKGLDRLSLVMAEKFATKVLLAVGPR